MPDIFYNIGREFRWQDLRIPRYWLADLRFAPLEFYRGIIGKGSIAWQNANQLAAIRKDKQYDGGREFSSVRLTEQYNQDDKKTRYEAADSFASLSIIIDGVFYFAGNVIGSPVRFVKGVVDNAKGRKATANSHSKAGETTLKAES